MIPWLDPGDPFPAVSEAQSAPDGLLCAGEELTPERVLEAYRQGIFPWFSDGQPVLWWSTDPRMVLRVDELRISHSLKKRLRRMHDPMIEGDTHIEVRCDTAFEQVMRACAAPRDEEGGTWINEAMISTYTSLHRRGHAHSVETWIDGQLAGGLYGLSLGRMFFGESMFTRATDASKIALAHLVFFLKRLGCPMIDCQQQTAHLASMGARPVSRASFAAEVGRLVTLPAQVAWPSGSTMAFHQDGSDVRMTRA